ncbi:MAG: hypothetical protein AAB692_06375 [Patescibacteria group bacterium]
MEFFRGLLDSGVATIAALGLWSYPAIFGLDVAIALVTLLLIPSRREQIILRTKTRVFLRIDSATISHPFWVCLRSRGAFPAVAVAALILGPLAAAAFIRFFQLSERRAYLYAIASTMIETFIRVSFILYASRTLQESLGHVISNTP